MEDAGKAYTAGTTPAGTAQTSQSGQLDIVTPMPGTVAPLSAVPDPLFGAGTVGPGMAVVPDPGVEFVTVCAPVAGVVARLMPHLFLITTDDGPSVLVHIGIDTAHLDGQGYSLHVEQGQRVQVGERVTTYAPLEIGRLGFDPVVPVVMLQQEGDITGTLVPGEPCEPGDVLFRF